MRGIDLNNFRHLIINLIRHFVAKNFLRAIIQFILNPQYSCIVDMGKRLIFRDIVKSNHYDSHSSLSPKNYTGAQSNKPFLTSLLPAYVFIYFCFIRTRKSIFSILDDSIPYNAPNIGDKPMVWRPCALACYESLTACFYILRKFS